MEKNKIVKANIKKAAGMVNRENVKNILLKDRMGRRNKYILLILTALLIGFGIYIGITFVMKYTNASESMINEIDLTTYLSYNKSNDKEIVLVATEGSKVNEEYEKIVHEILVEKNAHINYLDLYIISSRNQIATFMKANELTKDDYTEPMILVFDEGKIVDSLMGVHSKSKIEGFLELNRAY